MDDLAIWDRALTACEISDLYNETNTLPAVAAGNDTTICSGQPITLNGSGATSYIWNQGITDGTVFNPTSTETYILTGMDAAGC